MVGAALVLFVGLAVGGIVGGALVIATGIAYSIHGCLVLWDIGGAGQDLAHMYQTRVQSRLPSIRAPSEADPPLLMRMFGTVWLLLGFLAVAFGFLMIRSLILR